MLFDQLAGIAERHWPQFKPMLDEARIFRVESKPLLDRSAETNELESWHPDEQTIENYRTPFPVTAIEEAEGRDGPSKRCVVLEKVGEASERVFRFLAGDVQKDGLLLAHGTTWALPTGEFAVKQRFDQFHRPTSFHGFKLERSTLRKLDAELGECYTDRYQQVAACIDEFNSQGVTTHAQAIALLEQHEMAREEVLRHIDQTELNLIWSVVTLGVLRVITINEPATFVVEERPLNLKDEVRNAKRIRRSQHRPHFIVLTPKEIRSRFITEQECTDAEPIKKRPHERRGHYRKLQSERYRFARGNVIWVDACWIGPREAVKGKNKYIVRLDV
jgi:hypothetical protein